MQYASESSRFIRAENGYRTGSAPTLRVIEQVNLRYLDYLASGPGVGSTDLRALFAGWRKLQLPAQLKIARMPFLLADLHFHDDHWWASWVQKRGDIFSASEIKSADTPASEMARHVLITAWHLAQLREFTVFPAGVSAAVASCLAMLAPHEIEQIAVSAHSDLKTRWADCPHFWSALFGAACDENEGRLAELRIHALRLLQHENVSTRARV